MKVLLDTCTFLWLALEPDRLSPNTRGLLLHDRATEPHLSMANVL